MNNTILITTAVNAAANKTRLINGADRLESVKIGIQEWLKINGNLRFVVCDGSGFDADRIRREVIPEQYDDRFEIISFSNDFDKVKSFGKGYGEGEIVSFALENSKTIAKSGGFVKCTGKLWVSNFLKCRTGFNESFTIDFNGKLSCRFLDTRFYCVSAEFYVKYLMNAHLNVRDDQGYYLEHAFRDAVSGVKLSDFAMLPTPIILGVSGSMGISYETDNIKSVFRDIRTKMVKTLKL